MSQKANDAILSYLLPVYDGATTTNTNNNNTAHHLHTTQPHSTTITHPPPDIHHSLPGTPTCNR